VLCHGVMFPLALDALTPVWMSDIICPNIMGCRGVALGYTAVRCSPLGWIAMYGVFHDGDYPRRH
jgi:hypothetical protein